MQDLLADLDARGLIDNSTDRAALTSRLSAAPMTLYYGCDPTADSLHVGNLIGLLILRRFQDAGHRPIALVGGATGMIGDPSGRSEERRSLGEAELSRNVAAIGAQMSRIVDLEGGAGELVDNRDWTAPLGLIEFLREVGRHVTVNQMLGRESVRARLASEQGISYAEFSYMLLQANDFLWLHDHRGCELQIGGSDQWGNIISGIDLVRRARGAMVHGVCWPLLTTADGAKIGKTQGTSTWLDAAKTSPYAFYQHWMAAQDADLRRMLAQFTLLPLEEVDAAVAAHLQAPEARAGQRLLAREVTGLVHGAGAVAAAEEASALLFGGPVEGLSEAGLSAVAREVPVATLEPGESLEEGVDIVAVLARSGLASSRGDARRLLAQGAISVNGAPAESRPLRTADLLWGRWVLLRRGKRQWAALDAAPGRAAPSIPAPAPRLSRSE